MWKVGNRKTRIWSNSFNQEVKRNEFRWDVLQNDWILYFTKYSYVNGAKLAAVSTVKKPEINFFPNPSIGKFNFSKPVSGKVFNTKGQFIENIKEETHLNLTEKPQGIYVLVLTNGETVKLIVKH